MDAGVIQAIFAAAESLLIKEELHNPSELADDDEDALLLSVLCAHAGLGDLHDMVTHMHDNVTRQINTNRTGGSRMGRKRKRETLEESRWPQYYLNDSVDNEYRRSGQEFRAMFGVPKPVFDELLAAVYDDLRVGKDAVGKEGMSPELAVLVTLRICRTSDACGQMKEHVGFSEDTIRIRFRCVVRSALEKLKTKYLPCLADEDVDREVEQNAKQGFPGCAGRMDVMKVVWGKCPLYAHGVKRGGAKEKVSVACAAVAYSDLSCGSLHFAYGANNDVNSLWTDAAYQKILSGQWGHQPFQVSEKTFKVLYFTVDCIYPKVPFFVRDLKKPVTKAEEGFARAIKAHHGLVERMFGIIQARFKIVRQGVRVEYHDYEFVKEIIEFCFMLHNMIIRYSQRKDVNERDAHGNSMNATDIIEEFDEENAHFDPESTVQYGEGAFNTSEWTKLLLADMPDSDAHDELQKALIAQNEKH
eukprot:m.347025 g.347025  ORF g.347025 m.347025 type:complete len:472 (-) comp31172_c0_seq1:86-1501(-)